MEIQKIFSNVEDPEENLYSVLMSEEELSLFSEFQKEFSSESKKKDQKLTNKEKAGAALIGTGVSSGAYLLPKINKDRLKGTVTRYHNTAAENVDSILDKGILGKYTSNPDNLTHLANVPGEENLVYLHKNKKMANQIGATRSMLKGQFGQPGFFGPTLDQQFKIQSEMNNPKLNKTLKVVLDYDTDVKGKQRIANPEMLGADGNKQEYLKRWKKKNPLGNISVADANYDALEGTHIIRGDIKPTKIVGSKHYKRRSARDIYRYARNNPKRFGKEVAKIAVPAGLVLSGAALYKKNKE